MNNTILKILLPTTLVVSLYSCRSKTKSKPLDSIVRDTTSLSAKVEDQGIPIDYDNTPVIKTVYVINRHGVDAAQQPDIRSRKLLRCEYGEKLEVIEAKGDWFGIRAMVTRKYKKNGSDWESSGWEKVYIPIDNTGDVSALKLIPEDLNVVVIYKKDKEQLDRLTKFLSINLIDEAEYISKKAAAMDPLVADTTVIKKKNGIIELPYGDKIKRYIDKPDAEEEMQVFTYVGNIPFLNKYVLSGSYWENSDHILIDKTTGVEVLSLNAYPNISTDKNYIISVTSNPYDNTGDLELYSIISTKIQLLTSVSFKNWMPVSDQKAFWSRDGYFYVAVLSSKAYWKDDGNLTTDNYQYLRIKIL